MRSGLRALIPTTVFAALALASASLVCSGGCGGGGAPSLTSEIAFVSNRDGDEDVFVMGPDGSTQTNLTHRAGSDIVPQWSPDGMRIAFDAGGNVWAVNRDGSGLVNLTVGGATFSVGGSWSADGLSLSYVGDGTVWLAKADGTGTTPRGGLVVQNTAWWSPDGSRIAYLTGDVGTEDVCTMSVSGGDIHVLTTSPGPDYLPIHQTAWSPDGSRLVFVSTRDGNGEVYAMNADGSGQTNVSQGAEWDEGPDWSPDGRRIVFVSSQAGTGRLAVVDRDGSNRAYITGAEGSYWHPSWSPDGRKIVCASDRGVPVGQSHIWLMDADGSGAVQLTSGASVNEWPTFQP
jgi:Tol biopolymer transport system component